MSALQTVKLWLVTHLGLAKDALHIHVALILFFASMALFRWKARDWRPLAVAIAAALIGELWDIRDRWAGGIPQFFAGNWHDVWNTSLWPIVIFALARWTPLLRR